MKLLLNQQQGHLLQPEGVNLIECREVAAVDVKYAGNFTARADRNELITVHAVKAGPPETELSVDQSRKVCHTRNRWNWLGEGRFLNEGSNGAMNSITGEYRISEDGSEKEVINCWFTDAKNKDFEIGYYHNTTGSPDKEQADGLDSETAFYDACSALEEQVKTFELNSFKPAE